MATLSAKKQKLFVLSFYMFRPLRVAKNVCHEDKEQTGWDSPWHNWYRLINLWVGSVNPGMSYLILLHLTLLCFNDVAFFNLFFNTLEATSSTSKELTTHSIVAVWKHTAVSLRYAFTGSWLSSRLTSGPSFILDDHIPPHRNLQQTAISSSKPVLTWLQYQQLTSLCCSRTECQARWSSFAVFKFLALFIAFEKGNDLVDTKGTIRSYKKGKKERESI